jgi:hypothetical protein
MNKTPRSKTRRPRASKAAPAPTPPADEDIARADKPCDPPIACATMAPPDLAAGLARDLVATRYEPPIERLGRKLVEAALARLEHCDPDRAVALTNAYIALVTEDERARA